MRNSKKRSSTTHSASNQDNDDDDVFSGSSRQQAPYEPSDSEDEYSQQEKMLLEKARSSSFKDKKNKKIAVMDLPLYDEDDDDDDDNDIDEEGQEDEYGSKDEEDDVDMDSDIEGKDDFDLPDQRAWGKTRKNFYNTDYVDQDYGGFDGEDANVAELEEQEAREIQKRLAAELDDNDFTLDVFTKTKDADDTTSKPSQEIIKTDLSQLSSRQKLALLEKEAPELVGIIEEFRGIMEELQNKLQPAMGLVQKKQISSPQLAQYIRTKYHLVNNYVMNMGFYLLLRARRLPVAAHPVVKRLLQYRQLLQQLDPLDEVASTQLDDVLNAAKNGSLPVANENELDTKKKKKLRLLSLSKAPEPEVNGSDSIKLEDTLDSKSCKSSLSPKKDSKKHDAKMPWENDFENNGDVPWATGMGSDSEDENKIMEGDAEELDASQEDADSKRAITWQMKTNKGLIARRKKEARNPRLKNRMKYRKAQIRIKGQIRKPRTEVQRYGGEMTGIKKSVSKSIKIK